MSWIDVYVTGAPASAPVERILLAHWESLGGWVRSLPQQVKVPALLGLLGGPLPAELTAAQVRRLESEFTLLREHPLAGRPLGEWSSESGSVVVVKHAKLPRPDIAVLALVVGSVVPRRAGLRFVRSEEA